MKTLIKLLKNKYNTCFSENGIYLEQLLGDVLPNKIEYLADCENQDKILVFTYLTYSNPCKFHITFSNDYTLADHCFPGSTIHGKCITVFFHCQDINFEKDILEFKKQLQKYL